MGFGARSLEVGHIFHSEITSEVWKRTSGYQGKPGSMRTDYLTAVPCLHALGHLEGIRLRVPCLGRWVVIKEDGSASAIQVIGLSPDRHGGSGASMIGHVRRRFPQWDTSISCKKVCTVSLSTCVVCCGLVISYRSCTTSCCLLATFSPQVTCSYISQCFVVYFGLLNFYAPFS